FHSYFSAWKTRFFLFLERILSRKCHLIVISPHQKKEIETYLNNPPSLSLIPLGLPLKSLSQTPLTLTLRKELNIEKSALLIGWVGRLAPIKNIFMFLNVAKTVHSLHKEVHFIIIGDGNMRAQVQEWIDREGLQQKIHILGFRSDLPNIYHSLDIVTLTSLNEGTPVSLLEACACSKPVVATRVGGIEDIISHGETGYLANGDDEESFSNSLLKLIQNPSKRHQMGRNGQKRTLQHYDINRLLQDLHTYYDNLLLRTDSQTSTIF
ncbi:MAG: glycosyltransferase family 4 protein, partial [Deltaproteobacteria bacterium]|nr:glycosyltransferase family 4 protein [Deltaproteobacteria bacterium]